MRRRMANLLLLALPLAVTGCPAVLVAAGAAGAGTLAWQNGWLRGKIDEPIERVHRASKAAVGDFKATIEKADATASSGSVDGTMPDGRRVVVETKALGPTETQVRVRVGFWGDQDASLRIFEQIKKHL